mmetsp:Transcript_18916/g.34080  ORF Transcript_18916/g.34080 Transcript_18916/m.34080 type:complete len:214 (-) Transcript_18916:1649-2290(-)|eukprot:CAMPEP_0201675342 /NCGR_PEP_ID=MMETSP0494-20130426/39416_1 /ASSEMBLY_ACC=CAM_ASM_000839 /TAXON_ID=420259 /ORGANISM="Thalassiosira gravida, Strain GMp14c1" /LENGTH=213 /DNA_ID=CAMNT_0048157763 /DNA_START=201 /DNA_END=842 /DNA_ORIENTATION=-
MGLIKKIKGRPSIKSIVLRRKAKLAAADAIAAVQQELELEKQQQQMAQDQSYWEIRVTSNPKEIPREFNTAQRYNWLTNKMDDFLSSFHEDFGGGGGGSVMKDNDNSAPTVNKSAATSQDDMSSGCGWLGHCWGSPYLMNKVTDEDDTDPTYESSYDDDDDDRTGDSSQPSLSRINQVLEVDALFDTVSDITSVPSIDDSDSESEKSTESDHS